MREIKFRAWDTDPEMEIDKDKKWMFYQSRTYGGGQWLADFECDFGDDTGTSFDADYVFAHSVNFTSAKWAKRESKTSRDKHWDRFILMQYTGLKDKNGKEIYEGDILRMGNSIGEVIWITGESNIGKHDDQWGETPRFALRKIGETAEYGYDIYLNFGSDTLFEVIGNIYENPELLK